MLDWLIASLEWIDNTTMATNIRESVWMFPALEVVHVVAIVFVIGSIVRVDLRLMGIIQKDRPITQMSDEMLPYTWMGFVIATIFGLLLWASKPFVYLEMAFFDVKMVLIALAGLNMLYFQFGTFKTVGAWDKASLPPPGVRFAGAISMASWISVVVCGRLIGFV